MPRRTRHSTQEPAGTREQAGNTLDQTTARHLGPLQTGECVHHHCSVTLLPTPHALGSWDQMSLEPSPVPRMPTKLAHKTKHATT
eukprot:3152386-Lingulodinium_polyedra.AAC.1